MAEVSPLRRRMIEDMTVRDLSPATQQSYIHAVSRFSLFFHRPPDRLGVEEVRRFQLHLVARGIFWSGLEPDRLRTAVLLWDHARSSRPAGTDRLRT